MPREPSRLVGVFQDQLRRQGGGGRQIRMRIEVDHGETLKGHLTSPVTRAATRRVEWKETECAPAGGGGGSGAE